MNLLLNNTAKEYPTPYLMARLRGRRTHFIRNWDEVLSSANPVDALSATPYGDLVSEYAREGIWRRFLKEFQWVYFQMNLRLKKIFQPLFLYFELKTILICLRYKHEGRTGADLAEILTFSVLSSSVKALLRKREELPLILEEFARTFFPPPYKSRDFVDIFLQRGLKGVEEEITDECLGQISDTPLHPVIGDFFSYCIDMRNIITFYKYMKWTITSDPVFIQGGSIPVASLSGAVGTNTGSEVERFLRQRTGSVVQSPTASTIEHNLLKDLTRRIRFNSRNSDITQILDYLWNMYIEARNLSILSYGSILDRETLRAEVVIE